MNDFGFDRFYGYISGSFDDDTTVWMNFDRQGFAGGIFEGEGNILASNSMGLWENGAADLEASQMQMLDQVIERLEIVDGDNILDFGCGWGCFANYIMSKFPNIRFTGLNLSHHQCEYIRHKMQDPQSYLSGGRSNF